MNCRVASTVLLAMAVGGCCNCLKPMPVDTRPLPAPITKEEQLDALNRRATELPRVVVNAEMNGVEFWAEENGKQKHESADGKLELQQHYESHSADVYVQAEKLAQIVFEAGKNETEWWFHQYGNPQRGAVGSVTGRPVLTPNNHVPLRADFVPDLLAITEISPTERQLVVMRVDDLNGTNDLMIERIDADGAARIEREIVVDRRSGEVRKVALFGENGELVVTAELDHYEPVTYSGGANGSEGETPRMPRHIMIEYPSVHARVGLTLERSDVPPRIKGRPFETPDWADLRIKPERME